MIPSYTLFYPELFLTGSALVLLLLENSRRVRKGLALGISGLSLLGAAALVRGSFELAPSVAPWEGFLKLLLLGGVLLVLALCAGWDGFSGTAEKPFPWPTFGSILLLSTVGLLLLVSARDFLLLLVAIELISVTSFVLTGFRRADRRSSEAAIKYFLVGAFSTALMIYGMSLVYGVTGSTAISALSGMGARTLPALPLTGALFFMLAGFAFKMALVPFHMWVPDVYEGAPTPITAFLSVAPKAAAFGIMFRVFENHGALHVTALLAVLSALTMTVGNLEALRQTNVKRLLAYSSVAQMGYLLMALVALGPAGFQSGLVYLTAYLFMNLGAFASVIVVTNEAKSETVEAFAGLASRSLPLALATTFFLLSLTGIPPLLGFVGKFTLFSATLQSPGLVWLAVVAALNSVVSLVYYFSIVRAMFFSPAERPGRVAINLPLKACLVVTAVVTLGGGILPNSLLALVRRLWP